MTGDLRKALLKRRVFKNS